MDHLRAITPMKAAVCTKSGPPVVVDIEKPAPREKEVLVAVRAAALNPLDYHMMKIARMMGGPGSAEDGRMGRDLAGRVEAVGTGVTQFRPGDEVFGAARGAFAEYVCGGEDDLAPKPVNLTFEQSAAVPVAGISALQGLRDKGRIRAGHKILINGAGGGVGTFAVQIAKSFGAEVTGVCSTKNLDMVRSIGADHVIDYTKEDFTRSDRRYDILLDCVADRALLARRRILSPGGIYIAVGFGGFRGEWVRLLFRALQVGFLSTSLPNVTMLSVVSRKSDAFLLKELIEAGKVTPVIDRRYALSEIAQAIEYLQEGHASGKVVITIVPEPAS